MWQSGDLDLLAWLNASNRASVLSGFVEAAAATASEHMADAESVAGSFVEWLGETSRSWLIVLDDLRDAADLDGLWPAGAAGRVLITAADPGTVSGRRLVRTLPVPEFSTREALSYLMGRLTADPDQRLGAIDLVVDLGCEPPALAQASSMIASSRLTCRDYRGYFAQRRTQLAGTAAGARSAAAVTWTLSVEHAERLSPGGGAQYLLALAALLDGHAIPGAVFATPATCEYLGEGAGGSAVDPGVAWNALLSLERAGLLTVDSATTPPTVRMAPTVQAAIRAATTKGVFERAAAAAADALLEVWPAEEKQPWLAADLRSCAVVLQDAAVDALWAGGSCHPLLVRAGRSMDDARLTGPAVAYWRELAATSDRIAGPSSPDTLMAGSQLADALMAAGQATEAVAWAQWVVAGRTRVLGPDDPSAIAARIALGHAFVAAGQAEAAVPVLEGAASDSERVLGNDNLDALRARDELAAACHTAGRPDDAIGLYRRTLADHERIQGPRHPDTMTTRQHLADTYLASGRVKDAISQLKRVIADRERVLGADHLDTIVARGSLASAYHSAGKMASALQLYEQACEGYARVLGPDDPETLERRANLATAYYKAGRLTDASKLLRDTVERCERVLPPDDPLTQDVRDSLSNITGE
jgi:tetratricopeptide (TPR) repeat protein